MTISWTESRTVEKVKTDYAPKDWLRPKQPHPWSVIALLWLMVLGLALIGFAAQAQGRTFLVLLEPSSFPATLDECQRARPDLGRPTGANSLQNGSGTPWHRRSCCWVL